MKRATCAALILALLFATTACERRQAGRNPGWEAEISPKTPVPADAKPEYTKEAEPMAEDIQTELPPTASAQEHAKPEATEMKLKIQIGDTAFTATLAENSSVDALKELMADGPLTLHMSDYANMEKGADLGVTLPQNNEQMHTQAGDIILYQGKTLVIYYDTNSWSLTPIGKIDHVDAENLRAALGDGEVTVTLSLESQTQAEA